MNTYRIRAGRLVVALAVAGLLAWASGARAGSLEDAVSTVPDPRAAGSWVYDGGGVIGARVADIDAAIAAHEQATGVEIGVVTLPSIGGELPKDFAVALFNHWGVGKQGQDNGILVLHVLDQRRVEIEVGYGLEATLTDGRAKSIVDEVTIPFFKAGSFADGHYETVRALVRMSGGEVDGDLTANLTSRPGQRVDTPSPSRSPSRLLAGGQGPYGDYGVPFVAGGAALWGLWLAFILLWGHSRDPYDAWKTHRTGGLLEYPITLGVGLGAGLFYGLAVEWWMLAPLAGALVLGLVVRWLVGRHFRHKPRVCQQCQNHARRLNEQEDNAHLHPGQVAEEGVGSIDYDVWLCSCGWRRIDPYRRLSGYSNCTSCSYRTFSKTGSRVVSAPTYTSSGLREVSYACAHCGYAYTRSETIPRLEKTTSSSSSSSSSSSYSSSSSSGGSWGGGSSGGGGAGGGY